MINPKIFKAVLMVATKETKDAVLEALMVHMSHTYDYNDNCAGHIIEMLVDKNAVVTKDKVNLDYIKKNTTLLLYDSDKYLFKDIKVDYVDNIDCFVRISYEYLEKINEDRGDVSYIPSSANLNFNDLPEILK